MIWIGGVTWSHVYMSPLHFSAKLYKQTVKPVIIDGVTTYALLHNKLIIHLPLEIVNYFWCTLVNCWVLDLHFNPIK